MPVGGQPAADRGSDAATAAGDHRHGSGQRRLSVIVRRVVVAGLPQSRICTASDILTVRGPPLRASVRASAEDGLSVTVTVCGP
jgi:hypothetical protein